MWVLCASGSLVSQLVGWVGIAVWVYVFMVGDVPAWWVLGLRVVVVLGFVDFAVTQLAACLCILDFVWVSY